jgi:Importin beta binding domain
MNTVQEVIRQKREHFHIQIRKERQEEIFRSKRRLITSVNTPESLEP